MPRILRRTDRAREPLDLERAAGLYQQRLMIDAQLARLNERRTTLTETLHDIAAAHGERDSKGNTRIVLPAPVTAEGKTFTGFKRQRSVSVHFDVESARRLALRKGVLKRVEKRRIVTAIDPDEFWALQQEGIITRDDIDALMIHDDTYSIRGI